MKRRNQFLLAFFSLCLFFYLCSLFAEWKINQSIPPPLKHSISLAKSSERVLELAGEIQYEKYEYSPYNELSDLISYSMTISGANGIIAIKNEEHKENGK